MRCRHERRQGTWEDGRGVTRTLPFFILGHFIFTERSLAPPVVCRRVHGLREVQHWSSLHTCFNTRVHVTVPYLRGRGFVAANWTHEKEGLHHPQVRLTYVCGFMMSLKPDAPQAACHRAAGADEDEVCETRPVHRAQHPAHAPPLLAARQTPGFTYCVFP